MTIGRTVTLVGIAVCLGGLAPAQDEDLPISNWSAPPYWSPLVQPRAEGQPGGAMVVHAQGMQAQAEALPSSPLPFVAIAPCRIVDTRQPVSDGFHQPNFGDDEARTFNLAASPDCTGLPATAGAWSLNVQFRPISQLSFLTAYPTGTTMPGVSTMTAGPAAWVQNAAIVPAGTGGAIDIYCQYAGRVVIDINGYYAAIGARFGVNRTDRLSWLTVKGGAPTDLPGTVTIFNGDNSVIGVGTAFVSQVGIGDRVTVNAETRTVVAVTDDTHLSVGSPWTSNATGVTITDVGSLLRLDDSGDIARLVVSDQGRVGLGVIAPGQTLSVGGTLGVTAGGGTTVLQADPGQVGTLTYTLPQAGTNGLLRHAAGTLTWDPATLLSGAGSAGQVAFWSGASSLAGSNKFFWDNASGRLGLGTTTPGYQLDLTGMINMPATAAAGSTPTAGVLFLGTNRFLHNFGPEGAGNTFVGRQAGNFTMGGTEPEGRYNTAIGASALFSNTTGHRNTASGTSSLYNNTTGSDNTATGYQSLPLNTSGYRNTASGYQAMYSNIEGYDNTANGYQSLYSNTTGHRNAASGNRAMYSNIEGYDNTVSGYRCLYSNTSGDGNTASGYQSLFANTTGYLNTASGYQSLNNNTTSYYNTAYGAYAGNSNVTGYFNTFLGGASDASSGNLVNATAVGYAAIVNASNKVRIGSTNVTVIEGQVDWSYPSDIRHKKDVRDLPFGLDLILQLRPVEYRLKDGNDRLDMGFVAQDIEALLGDGYNILGIGQDAERMLSLRRGDLIAPLVRAAQEQQAQISAQAGTIAGQQAQIEELTKKIVALEEKLAAKR